MSPNLDIFEVKVDLSIGERTIDLIDEGFDIAIRLTPPADSSLIVRSLATWRHVLCCSPDYLERHGGGRSDCPSSRTATASAMRFIPMMSGASSTGMPASVRVSGNLISNSGETLRRAALQGVGVCLAAGFLIADDLESGRLIRLLPEYRPVEFAMNAIYPHRHHLSAKVRSFIDLLAHHSAEQQKLINPYS